MVVEVIRSEVMQKRDVDGAGGYEGLENYTCKLFSEFVDLWKSHFRSLWAMSAILVAGIEIGMVALVRKLRIFFLFEPNTPLSWPLFV